MENLQLLPISYLNTQFPFLDNFSATGPPKVVFLVIFCRFEAMRKNMFFSVGPKSSQNAEKWPRGRQEAAGSTFRIAGCVRLAGRGPLAGPRARERHVGPRLVERGKVGKWERGKVWKEGKLASGKEGKLEG